MGILTGPEVLNIIKLDSIHHLNFINQLALSFIAFAAGAELYLTELKSRLRSIRYITAMQIITTIVLGSLGIYILSAYLPLGIDLDKNGRIAISIIIGTIFIARSPVSAIAIINELRAKGPFTRMVLGVTVLTDFLVVVIFSISFLFASSLITGESFSLGMTLRMLAEVSSALIAGYLLFQLIRIILSLKTRTVIKTIMVLLAGWGTYFFSDALSHLASTGLGHDFYIEPLLICITASLLVTNRSPFRREFQKIIKDVVPLVYVAFFTLIGASLSLKIISHTWPLALALFFIRIITMIIGSWAGGSFAGDPGKFNKIAWMPFVTQAGIGLGLVTVVTNEFPEWGVQFSSVVVSVIVLNQIIGPPLFKWAIQLLHEDHPKGEHDDSSIRRKALIFGYEQQSLALATQLTNHNWEVDIITKREKFSQPDNNNISICGCKILSLDLLDSLDMANTDALIAMKTDEENLHICEMVYENYGTPQLIVRLNNRENIRKFHELGALIVQPTTAIVSLLDHFVRSPLATSLLLGMEEGQETSDIIIRNKDIHGVPIRNLHLPLDILIVAIKRKGQHIISTGYTQLKKNDILTLVGSPESIEEVKLRFE